MLRKFDDSEWGFRPLPPRRMRYALLSLAAPPIVATLSMPALVFSVGRYAPPLVAAAWMFSAGWAVQCSVKLIGRHRASHDVLRDDAGNVPAARLCLSHLSFVMLLVAAQTTAFILGTLLVAKLID